MQQTLATRVIQFNFHLLELLHVGDDAIQQFGKIVAHRQRMIQHRDFFFEFGGNLQHGRDEDDGLETVLQVQRDFLELARDGVIALGEERMKILEDKDGWLDLFDDVIQRGERFFGGRVAILLRLDGSPRRHDARAVTPLEHFFLPPTSDVQDDFLHAQFLTRYDVKNWIPRPDQRLDFRGEIHL